MGPLDPFPTFAVATTVELSELALNADFVDLLFFGMLHIAELMPWRQCLWWANRIPALLPFQPKPWCLCAHHRIHCEFPLEAVGLFRK
jgi:hypothetical protein